ncbi:MAG TPA: type II secretion system protein [Gaiellaceae bacterium]|nr:type II secretion system protein [Gaiellaceae bacterium]
MTGDERGYTLIEMLVVMIILGVVVGGLTTIFVSGSRAQMDLNRRFQAQQQARLALDKIRVDLHCATNAQVQAINGYNGVAISAPNCSSSTIDWCLVPSTAMTGRYALYRTTSTTNKCASTDTGRLKVADYLLSNTINAALTGVPATRTVFGTMQTTPTGELETVLVDFPVSVNPTSTQDVYELKDAIVARNSARCVGTCTTTSTYATSP